MTHTKRAVLLLSNTSNHLLLTNKLAESLVLLCYKQNNLM
jgi:hypothetical protein